MGLHDAADRRRRSAASSTVTGEVTTKLGKTDPPRYEASERRRASYLFYIERDLFELIFHCEGKNYGS